MSRKIPNASEMGRKGGNTTLERLGSRHFAQIGVKGRATILRNDPDFYKRLSEAGMHGREVKKQREIEANWPVDDTTRLARLLSGR